MNDVQQKITKKDIRNAAFRYMFMACNTFNYENQQGPAVVYGLNKVLRKIYPNDDEYVASLNNHFKYFNTTTWMANILLGASLAMEEKDGIQSLEAVQNFKTGMMGPLAGVGDTLIWVLYPTIMGSIAAYMGLEGNPIGAIIWLVLNVFFLFFRFKCFDIGYNSGLKLVTGLGEKLNVFTESASIMGLTVVGALIPSVVKMKIATVFTTGDVKLPIQKDILDKIMPALLPAAITYLVYKLLASKKLSVIQIIFGIIILSLVLSYFGILSVQYKGERMTRVIIASHHHLATGMKDTIEYLIPSVASIDVIAAYIDNKPIEEEVATLLDSYPVDEKILVFTDLLGGSVNQAMAKYLTTRDLYIVTGMNLPVIMTLLLSIENEELSDELIRESIEDAKNQLVYVNDHYNQVLDEDDE